MLSQGISEKVISRRNPPIPNDNISTRKNVSRNVSEVPDALRENLSGVRILTSKIFTIQSFYKGQYTHPRKRFT